MQRRHLGPGGRRAGPSPCPRRPPCSAVTVPLATAMPRRHLAPGGRRAGPPPTRLPGGKESATHPQFKTHSDIPLTRQVLPGGSESSDPGTHTPRRSSSRRRTLAPAPAPGVQLSLPPHHRGVLPARRGLHTLHAREGFAQLRRAAGVEPRLARAPGEHAPRGGEGHRHRTAAGQFCHAALEPDLMSANVRVRRGM